MSETYQKLFGVNFLHTYYNDGKCGDIEVRPDHATGQLIQKYGYIFRQYSTGFSVFVPVKTEQNHPIISSQTESNLQFNFVLNITNPYLLNITELPEINEGHCYLFTNTQIGISTGDTKTHSFTMGKSVRIQANRMLQETDATTTIELIKNGKHYTIKQKANTKGFFELSGLSAGVYTYGSETTEKYLYPANELHVVNPFALISINVEDESIIHTDQSLQQPDYLIRLQSKKTYWKYIILKNETTDNLIIDLSNKTDLFEKTEEVLSGDKAATVFTSKQKIPITAARDEYFRLKLRNGDPENDLTLISELPLPEMNILNHTQNGNTYSPIYLNF